MKCGRLEDVAGAYPTGFFIRCYLLIAYPGRHSQTSERFFPVRFLALNFKHERERSNVTISHPSNRIEYEMNA